TLFSVSFFRLTAKRDVQRPVGEGTDIQFTKIKLVRSWWRRIRSGTVMTMQGNSLPAMHCELRFVTPSFEILFQFPLRLVKRRGIQMRELYTSKGETTA